jgi:hypothetical protein
MAPLLTRLGNGGGTIAGFRFSNKRRIPQLPLFNFNSFTFTPAGATFSVGPTYTQTQSSYDKISNSWLTNTNFFSVPTNGFQKLIIPKDGLYRIEAAGAQGGGSGTPGGSGGIISGDFDFTLGTELYFVVGQSGQSDTGGGDVPLSGGFNG